MSEQTMCHHTEYECPGCGLLEVDETGFCPECCDIMANVCQACGHAVDSGRWPQDGCCPQCGEADRG